MPRRTFLIGVPAGYLAARAHGFGAPGVDARGSESASGTVYPGFPRQDPRLVQQVVGRSHVDLDAVRSLVTDRPALAKASWDWGFGDWESALGAASHVGRPEIAELLIAHGARPDVFTFAMLDQVDAVRAIVEANAGIQRIHGPHGITLLAHARNGEAGRVIEYLESIGGADVPQVDAPLAAEQKRLYLGDYVYGSSAGETLTVVEMRNGMLGIRRGADDSPRNLFHLGEHTFHPTGAPAVRINFRVPGEGPAETLTVHDADLIVTGGRAG